MGWIELKLVPSQRHSFNVRQSKPFQEGTRYRRVNIEKVDFIIWLVNVWRFFFFFFFLLSGIDRISSIEEFTFIVASWVISARWRAGKLKDLYWNSKPANSS